MLGALRSVRSAFQPAARFSLAFNRQQHRLLSDSLRAKFDQAVANNNVVVFMKGTKDAPQCGYSRAVVQILNAQGVESFESMNVLADEEVRQGIKEYTSWPTIPQVFIKGEFIGGCDIILSMHQSGELEELLVKEGIVPKV
ncbi:thioredoxin-like protein [Polychytrium aggregatum]|uniref:thioredoxin-like protein n=1 Tax=Polychytrium aggregatum TaxID=110093 RepID=UPI0022FDD9FA|nr:thioredoxin-like protein [Polychytrium aggregatum]KAI9209086.1 thioredoxin-like protein [Polychytrium aggregatum]